MRTEALPEIIEIIDDDVDPFGERSPNTTINDTGGPRWVGPVAGAVLVALIGYGVATSASSTSAPKIASVTTTSLAPATTLPPPTTVAPPLVPYYAADPPREYSVQYADTQRPGAGFDPRGSYQLWATPGASSTSGSWFSIENFVSGAGPVYAGNSYRMQAGEQTVAISHTPSGQTIAQFSPNGSASTTLTSFGLSDEDLMRLVQSLEVERFSEEVSFADSSLIAGYEKIGTEHPWFAVEGRPVHQVYYTAGNDLDNGVNVVVAMLPSTDDGDGILDRQVALRFFFDHTTPFTVNGRPAVAGNMVGQRDYARATWVAGDHIITVAAAMSVPELIAVARTVHEVSAQEWEGMKLQAKQHSGDNNFGEYEETEPVAVSFGTDADAEPWTITVSVATFSLREQLTWQWDNGGFGALAADTPVIHSVVDGPRTYVLADLPRAVASGAQLAIARPGLDVVVVPFTDVGAELDRTFAAYAFSEPTPYSAQIVGADGTVLASWPS